MKRGILYLAFCLLLMLPPALAAAPRGLPETAGEAGAALPTSRLWHIEGVDVWKYFSSMGARSLALDAEGHPHIAYGGDHLYYAWHDGGAWQLETVDSDARVGQHTSLALDADGRPHISYLDAYNVDLKYAYFDGAAWQIETVDSDGWVGEASSLALDADGRPHISYFDGQQNYDVKYARFDGADWQIEVVDSDGSVGWDPSLALDTNGRPHIS
jgi:hypothetical protein